MRNQWASSDQLPLDYYILSSLATQALFGWRDRVELENAIVVLLPSLDDPPETTVLMRALKRLEESGLVETEREPDAVRVQRRAPGPLRLRFRITPAGVVQFQSFVVPISILARSTSSI